MAVFNLGLNPILNLVIIVVEFVIFAGFLIIFINKKITVLKPLIWSIFFFLLSNIFGLLFLEPTITFVGDIIFGFLSSIFVGLAMVLLVTYLESFERDEPFSRRSSITILLIALTSILQIVNLFRPANLMFLVLLAPLPYLIIGIFYFKYIRQIINRARTKTQKKKIRKVQSGVFILFLVPVAIYTIFTISLIPLIIIDFTLVEDTLAIASQNFNMGSLNLIVIFCQLVGVILISYPILRSRSTHFMQSQRIARIIVILDSGLPVFDFNFEKEREGSELLFSGAITAIQSVMREATGTSSELQSIVFGDLHILTEVREGFAVNLLVERSSAILKDSLAKFTEDYEKIFPRSESAIFDEKADKEALKLVQQHFGIEIEELEQVLERRNLNLIKPDLSED